MLPSWALRPQNDGGSARARNVVRGDVATFDPYRSPFFRKSLSNKAALGLDIHPLERAKHKAYFESKNPGGYQHELGAQDIFLDDIGLLAREQFNGNGRLCDLYLGFVKYLLDRWLIASHQVSRQTPWWGKYFNSKLKKANAGEPRNVIRLLADRDLSNLEFDASEALHNLEKSAAPHRLFDEDGLPRSLLTLFGQADDPSGAARDLAARRDWDAWMLLHDREIGPRFDDDPWRADLRGVVVPEGLPERVREFRILHPRECTPDLPARVGLEKTDKRIYGAVLRDQGSLPTCISHAISMGLGVLARRKSPPRPINFSPLWIHREAGFNPFGGGQVSRAIEAIRETLPCEEAKFRYPRPGAEQSEFVDSVFEPENMDQQSSRTALTEELGPPLIQKLEPTQISHIKALLAGGWVVVLSTRLTDEFLYHGLKQLGVGLRPLPGQRYRPQGHAWLLVGFDHVDGRNDWKYQGRFFALNSWGEDFPQRQPFGPGLCSFPFSMLLTGALEAFALRLRE